LLRHRPAWPAPEAADGLEEEELIIVILLIVMARMLSLPGIAA
jgi:hypothetical protein